MNAPIRRRPVLALDFDGVICDSLAEGLLISWNAYIGAPVEAFADPGLAGVPPDVTDRFTRCRPFARHLGHWLVPLVADSVPAGHREFAERYDALTEVEVLSFMARAGRYRALARRTYPEQWLAHHRVELALGPALAEAYVVTARDVRSVRQILDAHAIGIDGARIFGSRSDKNGALRTIAVREAVEPAGVTLVDDNVENCAAARAAGYAAWWATWGYTSEDDGALAASLGIPAISIATLRRPWVAGASTP
jgi:phosphoglycolate phosphatase-like HAD superfamily hydrolase